MSERDFVQATMTVQKRDQSSSGFEKNIPTWTTATTIGVSGTVAARLLDAGAKEMERAQANGEIAAKVVIGNYPLGLSAQEHRFQTSGGTNYRIIEVHESSRRGLYVCAEDTS